MLQIQHVLSKRLGCEGMSPVICFTLKGSCLAPPNSVLVILNMPFFEVVAPMCLIHLCQENVFVFLLQYLLNCFELHMIP